MQTKTNKKMGRPLKVIDWPKVESLCKLLCTESEIASVMDCHIDTLYEACKREHNSTFPEFYKKHSDNGKMSVRRAQFKKGVVDGHPTMLIWLGKQMLGQRDQVEFSNTQPIQLGYDPTKLGEDK